LPQCKSGAAGSNLFSVSHVASNWSELNFSYFSFILLRIILFVFLDLIGFDLFFWFLT
jgi:hypothetical protein